VVWSMLNPILYLAVFYVVFQYFLRNRVDNFHIYLLSGLLPWTLFSTGFQGATASIVNSSQLVTKVAFPREILPLSVIGASITNFFFQFLVLLAVLAVFTYPFLGPNLLLLPLAFTVLLLFTAAVSLAASSFNVRYRDTAHLVELLLLAWFWSTPIVYPASLVAGNLGSTFFQLYLLNPVAIVVLGFQRALYGGTSALAQRELPDPGLAWYAGRLGIMAAVSLVLLWLAWRSFYRLSADFAEEL
jgi:ABC-2 type transport system permease protein